MEVTEVRVEIVHGAQDRLRGFATLIFDRCFVVRDIRILEGPQGLFVAMPSRKLARPCEFCNLKNPIQAKFCNNCGRQLQQQGQIAGEKLHCDVAHPINQQMREKIHRAIVAAYQNVEAQTAAGAAVGERIDLESRVYTRQK